MAEAKECPLVPEQTHTPSAEPQPGLTLQDFIINLSVTNTPPLHRCISSHCLSSVLQPVCQSACVSHFPPSVLLPSCCQYCDYKGESTDEGRYLFRFISVSSVLWSLCLQKLKHIIFCFEIIEPALSCCSKHKLLLNKTPKMCCDRLET